MKRAATILLTALALLAALAFAISRTNDDGWLTLWFLMAIFGAVPFLLMAIRDFALAMLGGSISDRGRSWALLHTCAAFATLLGYGVYALARASDNPMASRQAWLIVVFPALVYLTPVLLALHGNSSFAKRLFRANSQARDLTNGSSGRD
jgi:hypothetical protein